MDIVHSHIEDKSDNRTRFLVLGKEQILPSGGDKTSVLVSVNNEPGALLRVLEPFQNHGISLTRIETRPERKGNWSYVFFIDFDGHLSEQRVEKVFREVGEIALNVRFWGLTLKRCCKSERWKTSIKKFKVFRLTSRQAVEELAREMGHSDVIKLASNENPWALVARYRNYSSQEKQN